MGNITRKLNSLLQNLNSEKVADVAYRTFKDVTPIDKGNARRRTRKQGKSVVADYPYAQRLNEGYSKQAPNGMTEPTIKAIRDYVFKTTGTKL
jgi:hypothetical protein